MAMTVGELLAEPHLGLRLLAGGDGLEHAITWAHTSDLPKLWEWVSTGVLLMTNGMSIPADPAEQVRLAESLVDAGAVALAVGEKMHAPHLSAEFLGACAALPLPLLAVPFPLPFMAISRAIAEASLLEESRRIKQTARIYDLLRKATTVGETWTQLIGGITGELHARIYVVDDRCLHPWQPQDQLLPEPLQERVRDMVSASTSETRHFYWSTRGTEAILLMDLPTHPHALLVVVPEDDDKPDGVVLLHAATVLGLGLSRSALSMEDQHRSGGEFMLQASEGRVAAADASRRLHGFGLSGEDLRVVSIPDQTASGLPELHRTLWRHGVNSICVAVDGKANLLVSAQSAEEHLMHIVDKGLPIGMSTLIDATCIDRGFRESRWALGQATARGLRHLEYSDAKSGFGFSGHAEGEALVRRLLAPVIDHDRKHQTEFMLTLKTYLENQRSAQKSAALLFVHRQTVIYRIKKTSELTGLDITETAAVAQLWLAFQILETMGYPTTTPT